MMNDPEEAHQNGLSEEISQPLTNGAYYARTLFDRHAIPKRERSRLVERVVGLAYSAAHRRVRGQASWTFEELAMVAASLGETLDEVFLEALKLNDSITGDFLISNQRTKCNFWLGDLVAKPAPGALVARQEGDNWVVVLADASSIGQHFAVKRILLEPRSTAGRRVAVLDDVPQAAQTVCEYLQDAGFQADPYFSVDALLNAVQQRPYDGYVLDWLVGNSNARNLIVQLRMNDDTCPIAILTGQGGSTGAVASDIADMVATHGVQYFSKAGESRVITATLQRLMADRPPV